MDTEDAITEMQANIIAHDYNFCPYDPLKCERVIGEITTHSIFFCNTSHRCKCLIQYDRMELEGFPP